MSEAPRQRLLFLHLFVCFVLGGCSDSGILGLSLSYLLALGEVLSWDHHPDVPVDLRLNLKDSRFGLKDAGWLVNLLALLLQLIVLYLPVLVSLGVFLQVVHHFFHWEALTLGEGVLTEQVQVLFFLLLEEMPLED